MASFFTLFKERCSLVKNVSRICFRCMREINRIEGKKLQNKINEMVKAIVEEHNQSEYLVVAGIANGGVGLGKILADSLKKEFGHTIPYGTVDILFHRDDLKHKPIPKITFPTDLPFDIEGATVILVDDVLFTGRTVRAAINELFDQGRPACIKLAVLFDRGNHHLPFMADYIGISENIPFEQKVVVSLDVFNPAQNHLAILSP
jgi:pyrimidine operon attenuation protein / uracil phosphoribosyltransferase